MGELSTIKFSILIPVYNVKDYIECCLNSVLQQKYENIEIIIIDDGSTDSSGEICDSFAKNDSRITVVHKKNEGLLAARRDAIALATGDYILFLDSDDYWESDLLKRVYETIKKHSCDMVVFDFQLVFPNEEKIHQSCFERDAVFEGDSKIQLYRMLLESSKLNNLCNKVVARSIMNIDNMYTKFKSVSHGEDLLQSTPLIIKAEKIVYLNQPLYCYRQNSGMTTVIRAEKIKSICIARNEVVELLKKTGYPLKDSIERSMQNFLEDTAVYIIYGYMDKPEKMKEMCRFVFASDFYKKAKESQLSRVSKIKRFIINAAEHENFVVVAVTAKLLKLRNKLKKREIQ